MPCVSWLYHLQSKFTPENAGKVMTLEKIEYAKETQLLEGHVDSFLGTTTKPSQNWLRRCAISCNIDRLIITDH
ncbi:hypothetical protein Pelo_7726 [Pelomyxa schiedti]|nr:hypothetical protein Pelo_7726 [Pelomyxa schiedti]